MRLKVTVTGDRDGLLTLLVRLDGKQLMRVALSEEVAAASSVEMIIDQLPPWVAADPLIGCAVRAGLSAIINRAIACYRSERRVSHPLERAIAVVRCITGGVEAIGKKAALKFVKCAVMG